MASDGLLKPSGEHEPCLRPSCRSSVEEAMLQADAGQNRIIILGAHRAYIPKTCVLAGSCVLMCPGRLLI